MKCDLVRRMLITIAAYDVYQIKRLHEIYYTMTSKVVHDVFETETNDLILTTKIH